MANIKLTELAKRFGDKTPVTSNNLSGLQEKIEVTYRDLHLDFVNVSTSGLYKDDTISSSINIKDIQLDTNEAAIINSVRNWLRTTKYSRLLNPDISVDLRQYLFEPVDEYTAYFIGMDIMKFLPYYEPRIKVENCSINVDQDNGVFDIQIIIGIPEISDTKQYTIREILGETLT